ncbi:MAG: TolB family protein [Solirubrobacteraceae bacterium]
MATAVAQAAAPVHRTLTGRILVYTKGLSLRIWDPINGVHEIDSGVASGGSPSLTSDGRFVAYAKNDGHGCYAIHLWDTHLRKAVKSLSGLADPGQCNGSTHISPDAKFITWASGGAAPGDGSDIYLYDVATHQRVPLPAVINGGVETSPSIARAPDGHYLLAFVHGNASGADQVFIADLGLDPPTTAAAATLLPTPGLPPADGPGTAQEQASISADGSTVAFVTGPDLGQRVWIYNRPDGSALSPAVLGAPEYQVEPSVSATGRYVVVDRKRRRDLVAHLWVFDRQTGALSPASPTWTGSGEDQPAIADPAPLVDVTPPVLGLQCRRQRTTVSCTLKASEPISGAATLKRGRHTVGRRKLTASTPRTLRFTISLGRAKPNHLSVVAAVKDSSGNPASTTARVR